MHLLTRLYGIVVGSRHPLRAYGNPGHLRPEQAMGYGYPLGLGLAYSYSGR